MTANIRPKVEPHSECRQRDRDVTRGRLDDVRRCQHGKVQMLVDVPDNHPIQGPGMWYWFDLSRIFNPILYRRATQALDEG